MIVCLWKTVASNQLNNLYYTCICMQYAPFTYTLSQYQQLHVEAGGLTNVITLILQFEFKEYHQKYFKGFWNLKSGHTQLPFLKKSTLHIFPGAYIIILMLLGYLCMYVLIYVCMYCVCVYCVFCSHAKFVCVCPVCVYCVCMYCVCVCIMCEGCLCIVFGCVYCVCIVCVLCV